MKESVEELLQTIERSLHPMIVKEYPKLPSTGLCNGVVSDDDEREILPISGTVQNVEVVRGSKAGPDYGAYAIVITTDQGQWTISGCHDMGPELETEG